MGGKLTMIVPCEKHSALVCGMHYHTFPRLARVLALWTETRSAGGSRAELHATADQFVQRPHAQATDLHEIRIPQNKSSVFREVGPRPCSFWPPVSDGAWRARDTIYQRCASAAAICSGECCTACRSLRRNLCITDLFTLRHAEGGGHRDFGWYIFAYLALTLHGGLVSSRK